MDQMDQNLINSIDELIKTKKFKPFIKKIKWDFFDIDFVYQNNKYILFVFNCYHRNNKQFNDIYIQESFDSLDLLVDYWKNLEKYYLYCKQKFWKKTQDQYIINIFKTYKEKPNKEVLFYYLSMYGYICFDIQILEINLCVLINDYDAVKNRCRFNVFDAGPYYTGCEYVGHDYEMEADNYDFDEAMNIWINIEQNIQKKINERNSVYNRLKDMW